MPTHDDITWTIAGVLDKLGDGEPFTRWLVVFDNAEDRLGAAHTLTLACANNLAIVLRVDGDATAAPATDADVLDGLRGSATTTPTRCAPTPTSPATSPPSASTTPRTHAPTRSTSVPRPSANPDHPYNLACAVNLVADLRATGEADRARNLWEDPLPRLERTHGLDHPAVVAAITGHRAQHEIEPPPS